MSPIGKISRKPVACATLRKQSTLVPFSVIARRLHNYDARMRASDLKGERQRRLLHASFIVEFGLEHGMPELTDATSEDTLKQFLRRLAEWEGAQSNELVKSLVLDAIPPGPAQRSLRKATFDFFADSPGTAIVGGIVAGGVIGMLVAGAAVAVASTARNRGPR